ncbi:MAG: glycosyl transferase [Cyanobacteria bacterium PR.3.49]|nr:glycosyl transferase [Cyanobacteria bacterium PR.3.49]
MKVSIVIPLFNQWQYLQECVESALSQTYSNVEVLVVDDGSPERPDETLLRWLEGKNVPLFTTGNKGPSASRNYGIEKATGALILPLDADDRIAPEYVEAGAKLYSQNNNAGIVYCDAEFFGDQSGPWELPPYSFPDILLDNFIFASGIFRKADWHTVGGYNENMIHGWEDHDFWLSIISLKRDVIRIPKTLFYYRKVANSRTRRFTNKQKLEMLDTMVKNHPQLFADNLQFLVHRLGEYKLLLEDESSEFELKNEVQNLRDRIRQMESSGFWRLRNHWQEIKGSLGINSKVKHKFRKE